MSTRAGTGLAQEIYDEFLLCKICFAAYRNPKSLTCMHTFCAKCIEDQFKSKSTYKRYSDYREFTCPLCYKRTPLPTGGADTLPDNFTVSSLLALIGPQCPKTAHNSPSCDICKRVGHKHRDASAKCLDCAKMLCAECARDHRETKVTSGHSLFGVQVEKEVQCREHQEEAVRFYCIPCDACICVLCTFNKHLDHRVIQFAEAVSNCRGHIGGLLAVCAEKATDCERRAEAVVGCEKVISTTTQKIKDAAEECVQEVRNAELRLMEELRQMLGPEVSRQVEKKKELIALVEGMRSTCDITDIILGGKEIELLLLKKDVQEKLTSMNAIDVPELPEQYPSNIDFLPGNVDLGRLWERDKQLLSTMRAKNYTGNPASASATGQNSKSSSSEAMPGRTETASQIDASDALELVGKQREALRTKVEMSTMTDDAELEGRDSSRGKGFIPPNVSLNVRVSPPKNDSQLENDDKEPRRRRRKEPGSTTTTSLHRS